MESEAYRIPFVLFLLVSLALICGDAEVEKCPDLYLRCPDRDSDKLIYSNCELLHQEVKGETRYFRFYDCEKGKALQSSVSADCTLVEKSR